MDADDPTVRVLVEIREELRSGFRDTNMRLDRTHERLDHVIERLERIDATLEQQDQRFVESEIRTATAIAELHVTLREIEELKKRVN